MDGWTVLIAAHAAGATLAVLLGGFNLGLSHKGDLLHRRIGRIWFVDMYWVAFSSFGIKRLNPGHFSWIHGLSLWTILSLTIALWAAATHRIDTHKAWVAGSYFGLLGAGIAAVAFPQRLVPQTAMRAPLSLLGALAGLTALAWLVVRVTAKWSRGDRPADLGGVSEQVVGIAGRQVVLADRTVSTGRALEHPRA